MIGVLSLVGFLALMSPQKSLTDFAPFLPLSLTVGLLTATSVVPWFKKSQSRDRLTYENILLATAGHNPPASDAGTVDPNSTRSNDRFSGNVRPSFRNDPLEFAHFGGGYHETFAMSIAGEDIVNVDLEPGLHRGSNATSESENPQDRLL